jgi:carbamoyltransferase
MGLHVGIGGIRRHACAALADDRHVLGICEQERITRVRGAGCNASGLPDEALDALLADVGSTRADISGFAAAEPHGPCAPRPSLALGHHEGHAYASYLTSPFDSAVVVICDHEPPGVSAWMADGANVRRLDLPWEGRSLSDLYSESSTLIGFNSDSGDQRFEALARLMAARPDERLPRLFTTDGTRIIEEPQWQSVVDSLVGSASASLAARARVAAALQGQIADVLVDILRELQRSTGARRLCLGGSLFYHSSINTAARQRGGFEKVFVPANPGNAGLSVGMAMKLAGLGPRKLSAFMGPMYDPDTIKSTLDNCKLRYDWMDEGGVVEAAVHHLRQGRLVGWFEGRMEWGPRALGARSILASPFSPYVLENLNTFLKRRESWRGYAVSVPAEAVGAYFTGPDEAPFMECDYRPADLARFKPVLPSDHAHIRLHSVTPDSPPRFRAVLSAFGQTTGVPCLVNTSFNGFHEPIVCTPRDAVRVFFGSGLDVLIVDQFIVTK